MSRDALDQDTRAVMPMPNRRQFLTGMAGAIAPGPWTTTAVDHVLGTRELSDADKVAILGANLIKLLRLDPVS
jgi:hypothetical protein